MKWVGERDQIAINYVLSIYINSKYSNPRYFDLEFQITFIIMNCLAYEV